MTISVKRSEALIRDLKRLQSEIPALILAIQSGDQARTEEAIALLTQGSSGRTRLLMDRLTDTVLSECMRGNSLPLQMIASGEAFR